MNLIELASQMAGVITSSADAATGAVTAIDKVKGLLGASKAGRDPKIEMAIAELQTQIANTLAANAELQRQVTELSTKLRQSEAFEQQKENYFLWDTGFDCMVLRLKEDAGTGEPVHCICPNCAERGKKSILQGTTNGVDLVCQTPDCEGRFQIETSAYGSGASVFQERFPEDRTGRVQQRDPGRY